MTSAFSQSSDVNFLFQVFGVALIAVGIWTVVDKVYVSSVISDDLFSAASYIAIIVGVILLGIAVLGFCSVRMESRLVVVVVRLVFVCVRHVVKERERKKESVCTCVCLCLVLAYFDPSKLCTTYSYDSVSKQQKKIHVNFAEHTFKTYCRKLPVTSLADFCQKRLVTL
jgi:hypothetical protein